MLLYSNVYYLTMHILNQYISRLRSWHKDALLILVLIILATATRFFLFGYPKQIVFDEVYFAQFVSHYFDQSYYFDIHPPLAKLIMAGVASLAGKHPSITFQYTADGTPYTDNFYVLLRGIVSVFGIFLPLVLYAFLKKLFKNRWIAFIGGLLVIFDNALLAQSRFVLTDMFLLVFGIAGLWGILAYREAEPHTRKRISAFILGSLGLAAAASVKWTGLVFSGVAGYIFLYDAIVQKTWKMFFKRIIGLGAIIFVVYTSIMTYNLSLLPYSGPGDDFMSPAFQKTLIGTADSLNPAIHPLSLPQKLIELNKEMYTASSGITATHPYGSKWYTWPFMVRPIYLWNEQFTTDIMARIYLLGNPAIWWLGTLTMAIASIWVLGTLFKKKKHETFFAISILVVGFWGNLLPYIFITRVAFLYHYFPSLLMAIGVLSFMLWRTFKNHIIVLTLIMAGIVFLFFYFAPLSYGIPLDTATYQHMVWFPSWE